MTVCHKCGLGDRDVPIRNAYERDDGSTRDAVARAKNIMQHRLSVDERRGSDGYERVACFIAPSALLLWRVVE